MMNWGVSQPGEWSALQSGGAAADTSVLFASWQQGEQTVAGVGVVLYYSLGSVQTKHFTNTVDVFGLRETESSCIAAVN